MSEANTPFFQSESFEPMSSQADLSPAEEPNVASKTSEKPGEVRTGIPRPTPVAAVATWAENAVHAVAPPDPAELLSLIQELNQCNTILLDRVSQLEEALERSQTALQDEIGRSQEAQPYSAAAPEDLAAAQEQIVGLFNQLEFAHQTNQRQQILAETLAVQLEGSQERVGQLEREAALLQQRYDEQAQRLMQTENSCRDLRSRLQRQQRYTLQYKAALEKCLEMPVGNSASDLMEIAASSASDPAFLPKVQRIQPWSSEEGVAPFAGIKLAAGEDADLWSEAVSRAEVDTLPQSDSSSEEPQSEPAEIQLPVLNLPASAEASTADAPVEMPGESAAPISYDLRSPHLEDSTMLSQQLEAAIQPLADLLAAAVSNNPELQAPSEPPSSSRTPELERVDAPSPDPHTADLHALVAEELLQSMAAEAEDALWQDLAQRIEVSAADVVQASLSGDFTAFETLNAALQNNPADRQQNCNEPPIAQPAAQTPAESAAISEPSFSDPTLATSSWPSPIVHPLRPTKKRKSLAAVELPTFARQEPSKA